jgi:predicted RNA-binding protein with PIN domain
MPSFIIDGYNVTRGIDQFSRSKPNEERRVLFDFLLQRRPQGNNPVTVVFDGRPGRDTEDPSAGAFRVIFSDDATADDWIKRLVDHESNPRNVVVVTADKTLARWVRGAGARVVAPVEFIRQGRASAPKASAEKEFDETITEELKSLWLKKKNP